MGGSGALIGAPIGVTLPGRFPPPGMKGLGCAMLPVRLCPSDEPGGGDNGLISAIGERGDLKGGKDLPPMGGSPRPNFGGKGELTFMEVGRGLTRGGRIGCPVPGAGFGPGIGDMGAMRPPPGLGNGMPLFKDDPRSAVSCGFSGGSGDPIEVFMGSAPT